MKRPGIRLVVPPMLPVSAISADAAAPSVAPGSAVVATPDALSRPLRPVVALPFRLLLKRVWYLVAILLLPGALIVVPLLWWLERRRIRAAAIASYPAKAQ
jgi:hypothetical protein